MNTHREASCLPRPRCGAAEDVGPLGDGKETLNRTIVDAAGENAHHVRVRKHAQLAEADRSQRRDVLVDTTHAVVIAQRI
jgi:hypothetical protein